MGETYCNVQLSVLRLASTQCFLAGKGRLTITLMGWPPILLPAQKLSSHSEAELVVVENQEILDKYFLIWKDLPQLKYAVVYGYN